LPGLGLADQPRILIRDPGHLARAGRHIGRWNVAIGAQHLPEGLHPGVGQALSLHVGERVRIDADRALGTAERQVDHGAFAGHPQRQRHHLAQIAVGVEA